MAVALGAIEWRLLASPLAGVTEPDDACVVRPGRRAGFGAVLVDPAVHGEPGRIVRQLALDALDGDPNGLFERVGRALAGSPGASLAFLEIVPRQRRFTVVAIGSIHAVVVGADVVRFAGAPGIVGVGLPIPPARLDAAWGPGSWAVLASDGLLERWSLGRLGRGPADSIDWIVERLRAGGRLPDDATALVVRAAT